MRKRQTGPTLGIPLPGALSITAQNEKKKAASKAARKKREKSKKRPKV
jgi:hypothetical protein